MGADSKRIEELSRKFGAKSFLDPEDKKIKPVTSPSQSSKLEDALGKLKELQKPQPMPRSDVQGKLRDLVGKEKRRLMQPKPRKWNKIPKPKSKLKPKLI